MQFSRCSILLTAADVPAARDFYVRNLDLRVNADIGWFVGLERSDRPRDHFEMALVAAGHETLPPTRRAPTDGLVLAFEVEDARALADGFETRGLPLLGELVDQPFGQRRFYVAAPDGVTLEFFQSIPPDPKWMRDNGFD
ncbi:MAG: VOC family protein [Myxococcota bacterium]